MWWYAGWRLRAVTRNKIVWPAAGLGLMLAWAAADPEWGTAKVEKTGGAIRVVLENSQIRVAYGRSAEIIFKDSVQSAGRFDLGDRPLRNATVLDYGNSKKAVRLEFDGSAEEISIYRGVPVVEIDYPDTGETRVTDESANPGQFVQFAANGWT